MIYINHTPKTQELQFYTVRIRDPEPDPEVEVILANLRRRLVEYSRMLVFICHLNQKGGNDE